MIFIDYLRFLISYILFWFNSKKNGVDLRSTFLKYQDNVTVSPVKHHSHGKSAAVRAKGRKISIDFVESLGLTYHFYQAGGSEKLSNYSRTILWAKDLKTKPRSLQHTPFTFMTDTDYYVDMPNILLNNDNIILNTFVPSTAGEDVGEYSYCFDNEGNVLMTIAGGAHYKHTIWDYSPDVFHVTSHNKTSVFETARIQLDSNHQLILLQKIGQFGFFGSWLYYFSGIQSRQLVRFNPIVKYKDTFVSFDLITGKGRYRTVGLPYSYSSTTQKTSLVSALQARNKYSKVDVAHHVVKDMVGKEGYPEYLWGYVMQSTPTKIPYICTVNERITVMNYDADDFESKPLVDSFTSCLLPGAATHVRNVAAEDECVKQRITNLVSDVEMDKTVRQYANEFVNMFCKDKITPFDIEDVYAKQKRPTQKMILDQSIHDDSLKDVPNQTFMKSENYAIGKPPRNITTYQGAYKMDYSKYMYALTDYIKKHTKWYAFGLTPKFIGLRVSEVCQNSNFIVNSDFSRFDGHISPCIRTFEKMVLSKLFVGDDLAHVQRLHTNGYNKTCYTQNGVKYNSKTTRGSGSPETSIFNTIDNAFVAYIALRKTLKPKDAYEKLGIYGGDDGLTGDIKEKDYQDAVKMTGLKLTYEKVSHGELGVSFLSRFYGYGVWYGESNSMCDLKRQLTKLHITSKMNVQPEIKLTEKLSGMYFTDQITPIITDIIKKAKLTDVDPLSNKYGLRPFNSLFDESNQYVNFYEDWMQEIVDRDLPDFDFKIFKKYIHRHKLLDFPLCVNNDTDQTVILPRSPVHQSFRNSDSDSTTDNTQNNNRGRRKRSRRVATTLLGPVECESSSC